jgi:ABC-2 type transport system ATP-binding protein
MKDITSLCKRVICIHEGSITYDGKLDKLLKKISPVKDILIICKTYKDAKELSKSGFIIKNKSQKEITITIKKDSIKSTLKKILNKFDIEDLYINEPPVDEIIGNILIKEKL